MIGRMLGAAFLRSETYEEVEKDRGATLQALLVVVIIIVSIATVFGEALTFGEGAGLISWLVVGMIRGVVSWVLWALFTWIIGTTILRSWRPKPTGDSWRAAPV